MSTPIRSVLYAPNIEFQNEEWLKCSLLFWDSIYRIVPATVTPKDGAAVRLAQNSGLIRQVKLEGEDLSSVYAEFLRFIEGLPFIPAGLESAVERVHVEKVDSRLYPLLDAMAIRVDPEGWFHLPRELARGYMFYLAKAVSGRRNLATATDDADQWAIMPYFKERANFAESVYDPEAEAFYSFMIFTDILPAKLESVDMKKVIEFAAARGDEKARLRDVLQKFSESIGAAESPSHARDLLADYEDQIKEAKDDFKKSMGFYSEEQGNSLLTVGLPLALAVFSSFGGTDPFTVLNISKSICIGAVAAYSDYNKVRRKERKESYASYLVEIDENLKGRSRARNSNRIFEEFMND